METTKKIILKNYKTGEEIERTPFDIMFLTANKKLIVKILETDHTDLLWMKKNSKVFKLYTFERLRTFHPLVFRDEKGNIYWNRGKTIYNNGIYSLDFNLGKKAFNQFYNKYYK